MAGTQYLAEWHLHELGCGCHFHDTQVLDLWRNLSSVHHAIMNGAQ